MSYPLQSIRITDEHGTEYTRFFEDIDLDDFDLIGATGVTSVDVTILSRPVSPRATVDGPLGALIEAWIDSHRRHLGLDVGWQYLDANDIHTIAWDDDGVVTFINIFGYSADGRRAYRLRSIAQALGLVVEFNLA